MAQRHNWKVKEETWVIYGNHRIVYYPDGTYKCFLAPSDDQSTWVEIAPEKFVDYANKWVELATPVLVGINDKSYHYDRATGELLDQDDPNAPRNLDDVPEWATRWN